MTFLKVSFRTRASGKCQSIQRAHHAQKWLYHFSSDDNAVRLRRLWLTAFRDFSFYRCLQVTHGVISKANYSGNRRVLRKGPGEVKNWNKIIATSEVQTALAAHWYPQAICLLPVFLRSVAGPWLCLKPRERAPKTLVQTKDQFSNTKYDRNVWSTWSYKQ